ncbi:DUF3987 domain-containing protein [Methanoplanus endosymbiosus]|uniref:DUF3987 domain-containing protein n=1 Tax=Methanoplanus endosymbiosus TaxID=33865 RepID=A0A9E7TKV1_9EURY|nr:DUF3987 domain-containing protein [Methanoplanus endosymbiosus]UUX91621.1 DUF3987 domain-containing protein [Methanoplanus endosymbiosus]
MPELKINLEEDNFVQEYISTYMEKSGGFPEFKYSGALTALSICADRRIHLPLSFSDVIPNIWTILIGQSSFSGKSTAFDEFLDLIQSAGIGNKLPDSFSRQSLIECLAETPTAYYANDEVGGLLKEMHKKGGHLNGLSDDLCKYYDNPKVIHKRLTKKAGGGDTYTANNISMSVLMATTPLNFKNSTEPTDLESGLLARYLIVQPEGTPEYIDVSISTIGTAEQTKALSDRLSEIWTTTHRFENLLFIPSTEALERYNHWQRSLREHQKQESEDNLTLSSRLRIYVFKLAGLYYIGSRQFIKDANLKYQDLKASGGNIAFLTDVADKEPAAYQAVFNIPDCYFDEALGHVKDYFLPTSSRLLADSIQQNDSNHINAVINILKRAAENTLSRSQLSRRLSKYVHTAELDRILELLQDEGIIQSTIDSSADKLGRMRNTQIICLIDEKEVY